jgi:hypothetical protein
MINPYPVAGASIALAGVDKVFGDRAYERMFKHLGWSKADMRKLGGAEVLGGLLMVLRPTRRLGSAIVLAASTAVLAAEIQHGDVKLAVSRGSVLLTALAGIMLPG